VRSYREFENIYLCREFVDFRKRINGLVELVSSELNLEVMSKALFLFTNKRRMLQETVPSRSDLLTRVHIKVLLMLSFQAEIYFVFTKLFQADLIYLLVFTKRSVARMKSLRLETKISIAKTKSSAPELKSLTFGTRSLTFKPRC
jgi:hypothetical protein